jgi:hypothetical protein
MGLILPKLVVDEKGSRKAVPFEPAVPEIRNGGREHRTVPSERSQNERCGVLG